MSDVTVVIPTIPPRGELLARARASVYAQTEPPARVITVTDDDGDGPAAARNAGLRQVETEWVAFLDDDDEFLPHHLAALRATANVTLADLVYPRWEGINTGLFPGLVGPPWSSHLAEVLRRQNFIPVTTLVRTERLRAVGGFVNLGVGPTAATCEDWGAWLRLLDAGATFVHHPEVTWRWNGHDAHTSGRSWKTVPA